MLIIIICINNNNIHDNRITKHETYVRVAINIYTFQLRSMFDGIVLKVYCESQISHCVT